MYQRDWATSSIEQLLDMLREMDEELDREIAKSKKSDPTDTTSPAERNQEIVESGMILHELKQYIATKRSAEISGLIEPASAKEIASAMMEAAQYYRRKDYFKVIGHCNYVLVQEPYNIKAQFLRGLALARANMYRESINSFTIVLASKPDLIEVYRERAKAYSKLEDWRNVVYDQSEVLRLDPNDSKAYRERGIAYLSLNEKERAIADFDTCIALNHRDFRAFFFRAEAYLKLGELARALEDAKFADRWTNSNFGKRLASDIENYMNSQSALKIEENLFEPFFNSVRKFISEE